MMARSDFLNCAMAVLETSVMFDNDAVEYAEFDLLADESRGRIQLIRISAVSPSSD